MIGSVVGQYKLVAKLGEGGFATVFKATKLTTGETVAVKLLHPEYGSEDDYVRRFRREAQVAQALPDNPHIAKPLDFGTHENIPFLVMEYLDGKDLSDVLGDGGKLAVGDAVSIALQVAEALQAAHRIGVVHRDIKPQNIRITSSGAIKLMDFGIARPANDTKLTQAGLFVGTPSYIAPEVWEGKTADARSDLYALGIVLYEALGGQTPFGGDTPAAIMRQHLLGQARPLSTIRGDLPSGLDSIVLKAISRDPSWRFQTAQEFAVALRTPERPVQIPVQPAVAPPAPVRRQPGRAAPAWREVRPPVASPSQAYLVAGRSQFQLRPTATLIGRDPRSDIRLQDQRLSALHARIEVSANQYFLRDLGSRNGTYVNGQRIESGVLLCNGDRVQVGGVSFHFVQPPVSESSGQPRFGRGPALGQGTSAGTEEFWWAALCHASIVLLLTASIVPLAAAMAPLVIWLLAAPRSPRVGFHARQALLYQVLVAVAMLLVTGYGSLIWIAATLYAGYAALQCSRGVDYRYPLLGQIAATWR